MNIINLEPIQAAFPFNLNNIRGMMGVYMFANKENTMMYIGKSNDLCKRFLGYNCDLKRVSENNRFRNAVRKYSFQGFTLDIIELYSVDQLNFFLKLEGLTKKEQSLKIGKFLCEREAFWIKKLNTTDKNIGYNTCARSNDTSGVTQSEEARKRMSERQSGEKNGFWGKKHDQRLKQKVDQINPITGEVVKVWDSVADIISFYGMAKGKRDFICRVLRGQRKKFKGFGWRRHVES